MGEGELVVSAQRPGHRGLRPPHSKNKYKQDVLLPILPKTEMLISVFHQREHSARESMLLALIR